MLITKNKKYGQTSFLIKCDECEIEQWYDSASSMAGKRKFCSRSCFGKNLKGEKNPFFGKKHNEQTLKILKEKSTIQIENLRKDPEKFDEWRNKNSIANTGTKNHFYGKTHSQSTKKHLSKVKSKMLSMGEIELKYPRGFSSHYISTKSNQEEKSDSFYEYIFMKFLDKDNTILSWTKKHGIVIEYIFQNELKNYVPDFYIEYENGKKQIVEIKGYEEIHKKNAKFDALYEFSNIKNIEHKIVTQKEISEIIRNNFDMGYTLLLKKHKKGEF